MYDIGLAMGSEVSWAVERARQPLRPVQFPSRGGPERDFDFGPAAERGTVGRPIFPRSFQVAWPQSSIISICLTGGDL